MLQIEARRVAVKEVVGLDYKEVRGEQKLMGTKFERALTKKN